jgi:hypothetical protein
MNDELREEIIEDLGLHFCPIKNEYVSCEKDESECKECDYYKEFEEYYEQHNE